MKSVNWKKVYEHLRFLSQSIKNVAKNVRMGWDIFCGLEKSEETYIGF